MLLTLGLKTFQELENWKISFQSRLENTTLQETEVEAELTVANYRNKFYYLLCYEESAHIRLLNEKYVFYDYCQYVILSETDCSKDQRQ